MNSLTNATNLLRKTNTSTPQNIPSNRRNLPNSSQEASITLEPKVNKAKKERKKKRKLQAFITNEHRYKDFQENTTESNSKNSPKGSFLRMEKWLNSKEHYLVFQRIQHLHSDSQLCVTPVPRDPLPSGYADMEYRHTHQENTHTHKMSRGIYSS